MESNLHVASVSVSYDVIDRYGRYNYLNLERLRTYLEQLAADGHAISPVRRIVKVTREEITLPEFVKEYNNKCRKAPQTTTRNKE